MKIILNISFNPQSKLAGCNDLYLNDENSETWRRRVTCQNPRLQLKPRPLDSKDPVLMQQSVQSTGVHSNYTQK